ncbi:MAG: hypothetical protein HPZ91_13665 [Lentisphaeria bacterium]|nr:hypothetical protein [Lentisphaeria bacterium]
MKQLLMLLSAGFLLAAAAAGPEARIDSEGKMHIRLNGTELLVRDSLTLQTKEWKVAASLLSGGFTVATEGKETVYRWKNDAGEFSRRHRSSGETLTVVWEGEFRPGIRDGRYIELSLTGPRNSCRTLPEGPQLLAQGGGPMLLKSDAGTVRLDPAGSSREWKLQDLRRVAWSGHLRMLFFDDYQLEKGRKFKAVLTVSADSCRPRGDGGEYANIVIAPEIKTAPPLLPAVLTVHADRTLRQSTPRLFGVNNDWHGFDILKPTEPAGPEAALNPVAPDFFRLLGGVPLPFVRTAGTDSQFMDFRKMIGPNRERKPVVFWANQSGGKVVSYGLLEHFSTFRRLDPHTEFVYVIRLYNSAPEESRVLAEFLTGSADTEWGAKRIAWGVEKPVRPAVWELGNEMDLGGPKHMEPDGYVAACKAHMEAIRSVVPDAVFAAHAISSPWDPSRAESWQKWHRTVLTELAPELRYLVFHPYYRGLPPGNLLRYLDVMRDDIAASANPSIRLFHSEHAKWPPGYSDGAEKWRANWFQTHALVGVLDTAEWLLLNLNRPDTGAMTYHAFSAGPWGVMYRDRQKERLYTTGIAELFRFFRDAHHGDVLETELTGAGADPYREPFHFTGAAIRSGDGKIVTVWLNNRLPFSRRALEVRISGAEAKLVAVSALSAPSLESVNAPGERPIRVRELPLSTEIPPQSLVSLVYRLEP